MVNDLNTLSGALVECKDQLITELANQGVTATYDPTTGLLGLIAHIADIQGGEAILLTTDKNILSYEDNDTATLTATYSGGSGATVELYNANTNTKIGDFTDAGSGTYTYIYTSASSKDALIFYAKTGNTYSNSITLEDCLCYQTLTDNSKESHWTIPSSVSSSSYYGYSSNGWKYGYTSSYQRIIHNLKLTSPFSVEFTINNYYTTTSSNPPVVIYFYSDGSTPNTGFTNYNGVIGDGAYNPLVDHNFIKGGKYRIEFYNGFILLFENGTIIASRTHNVTFPTQLEFHTGTTRWAEIKDLKIKPLTTQ